MIVCCQSVVRRVCLLSIAVALWSVGSIANGQIFFWNRTGQTQSQTTTSRVDVTVNGTLTTAGPTTDSSSTEDLVAQEESEDHADVSPGGGGGDGGSGARENANGDNGINGDDESSLDGEDGPDFHTLGGDGGDDGTDGAASASGGTVGELELSPDDQSVLSWSFIHNQYANIDVAGGGGGGGGGAGLDYYPYVGGNGGNGGRGADADADVAVTQTSTVNVTAQLNRAAMWTGDPTDGRFTVDIGWTATGTWVVAEGVWSRTCTIVMTHSDGANLTIAPGTGDALYAIGTIPGQMCPFEASSNASLTAVTGELVVGYGDFVFPVTLNSTATIVANGGMGTGSQPVVSSIAGGRTVDGGEGGQGGAPAGGEDGADGSDGGEGEGGGASGGTGGEGFGMSGDGGQGGQGGGYDKHEDGIFQGLLEVWVDQPDP